MDGERVGRHLGLMSLVAILVLSVGAAILLALDAAPRPGPEAGVSVAPATSEAHPHGAGFAIEEPVTDENTRRELRRQLASASSSVDGIVTPADAEARGYVPVTLDLAFLGVHYLNPKYLDMPFSPKRPTHLIFDRDGPGGRMIGLMYYIHTPGDAPDGFVGPNDHWHNHRGACMANGLMLALDDVTEQSCTRLGGSLEPLPPSFASRWMLHVWVVPGNVNPWGTFADGNPALA